MESHLFATFLVAITLLTLTPGVDTLVTIRNSARGGWQDGFATSTGICCGLFLHATVSALGISVILLQSANAFQFLKLIGAGYLIWLGFTSLRGIVQGHSVFRLPDTGSRPFVIWRSLREGFLSNALNPKTALFYMAFLPQFIDPQGSALTQSLWLAAIHFVIAMLWQCSLALAVNSARHWLQSQSVSIGFNALSGSVLIYLGARLALTEN
ncbi:Threonine/homoserine/homoserine lactone efflux protein [Amphritea atlantica]|uniref:Threonine/homoserine/homoserine lactone efflux protein n=1 Tax=Amphritea atlantica TaxID=355243 RepID=A0A1H9DNM8_9GAMM|nr:LysE family translocator [Amphritea atlantica]SEQ14353.1 Threonine/homoserine/homoserine lactone efflux protein [Amphritea atlantica]